MGQALSQYCLLAGLRSRRKNDTTPATELFLFMNMAPALAPELLVFISVAPALELSFFRAWLQLELRLLFVLHMNISSCLGVPQFDWKMKYISYRKLNEYSKLI